MKGRVLIVAGSDSGGGAGIQADVKTVTALGGYAMTAITALTAQNTKGVFGIHDVPPEFVAHQIELCLTDIGADVIKTGMLSTVAIIEAVAEAIDHWGPDVPLVVDPVMVAKGGEPLLRIRKFFTHSRAWARDCKRPERRSSSIRDSRSEKRGEGVRPNSLIKSWCSS